MRHVVVYELLSLDGVAERPDDFITDFDEVMRENLVRVIATQDAVLLGRRTFDEWAQFWPTRNTPFASFINLERSIRRTFVPRKDSEDSGDDGDGGISVLEKAEEKTKEPEQYKVVLHNDDFTPKAFVVDVIVGVFRKEYQEATSIMLRAHRNGRAVVEIYTWDIAATKVEQVHQKAKSSGFPLRCSVEPE
ncbi:MAG: ATP-dependent Clp protease adaptor ClpS [Rectinemataceae bacterium]